MIYPAEYLGDLPYTDHTVNIGDVVVRDVHGYNPAGVYVRRISGKTDGISVAEIIVTVVGDGYAQEELDAENAEAERYPQGPTEFWRNRLVGKATYGRDGHPMTDKEFEADWAEGEEACRCGRVSGRCRHHAASSVLEPPPGRPVNARNCISLAGADAR